jgi:hypothetical protein
LPLNTPITGHREIKSVMNKLRINCPEVFSAQKESSDEAGKKCPLFPQEGEFCGTVSCDVQGPKST